jgi:hypothetical protein
MTSKAAITPSLLCPLTSNQLEKLPLGSLNSISEQVRIALLKVFLPRLCEICKPNFLTCCKNGQSTVLALKNICDQCKYDFIKYKKSSISPSISSSNSTCTISTNQHSSSKILKSEKGAKRGIISKTNNSKMFAPTPLNSSILNSNNINDSVSNDSNITLPITPPPCDEIEISNSTKKSKIFVEATFENLSTENTIFESLEDVGGHWCRYCGTSMGHFWKSGPWGSKTLCNKHGCEYLGCGFAKSSPNRINLTEFEHETRKDRKYPILQEYCWSCWEKNDTENQDNFLRCYGCPIAYHKNCYCKLKKIIDSDTFNASEKWFCNDNCIENFKTGKIKVNFSSRAQLPFLKKIPVIKKEVSSDEVKLIEDLPSPSLKLRINLSAVTAVKAASIMDQKEKSVITETTFSTQKRKNRKESNVADRIIISSVPIKVDSSVHVHENIFIPRWNFKSFEERQKYVDLADTDFESNSYFEENLTDEFMLLRHSRYEYVESHMRLLQPGVLDRLNSSPDPIIIK